ncbi:MAG: hypothetical protein LDLANPLL_00748 [Turneriella sp.]|nr:hypothetical protein [Turneriella sp.]
MAQWAKSIKGDGVFKSVVVDRSGNVYAAGEQRGNHIFNYGNGVTVAGGFTKYDSFTKRPDLLATNVVLVKYNANGTAQWAKSVTDGNRGSRFDSVAVDSSGNIYAVGWQGDSTFNYGNGVTVAGGVVGPLGRNAVLVKYKQ